MKFRKILVISFAMIFLVVSIVSVGAMSTPYEKSFLSETDMINSLFEYANSFPYVGDYYTGELYEPQEDCHLEYKRVFVPIISDIDYTPEIFSYAESSWGNGVNYLFSSYSNNGEPNSLRFITYYNLSEKKILESLSSIEEVAGGDVFKGYMGDFSYVAYEKRDDNNFMCCIYKIAVDECLIEIYSAKPFDKNVVELIELKKTDVLLPVYVKNDATTDVSNKYQNEVIKLLELSSDCLYHEVFEHRASPDEAVPEYVMVRAFNNPISDISTHSYFGKYIISTEHHVPYRHGYYIYVPVEDKVYTLEEAYNMGINGIEEALKKLAFVVAMLGDCDGNYVLNVKDATCVQKHIAGIEVPKLPFRDSELVYDFNRDGERNIKDATAIQKKIAGLPY